MVLGVCRRVLEDEHSAHDAAQAVFLALARKAKTLGRERALGGWLHHVAICAARNERIARARRFRREQEAATMQQAEAEELTSETVSGLREWLDGEIDALPAKYRRPLVMVHLEGRSLEETANTLGCKDGTLRVWLNRAKQKLRDRLVRRGVAVSVPALAAWLASNAESVAATVPPDLGAATVKNATLWVAGGTAAAGLAPNVVTLAKGAIHTMFMAKLKTAAIVTASVATIATASAVSWQKVYEARDKGLPKTAIEQLKPIIVDAMKNKQHAEAIKAIAMKIALEGKIEGSKPEEKIIRMQAEVEKAPAEMKSLMEAILAHWYWEYFQQNRWQFQQRTQTTEASGKDFTTWDLPRILAEIDTRFTAPAGRGTGQMYLQVDPGPQGSAYVNVEEYKRPKFQVELARPKEAAKLGAEVVVTGKATAYTGAAIGGAKVKWRVTRHVQFPSWCWWGWAYMDPDSQGQKNIAHGTTITAADGSFSVRFVAAPDLAAAEKSEPVFAFQVDADVTDTTGETRSGSYTTRAGRQCLSARILDNLTDNQ
jgi:RNA polymerase sigma factor (sigma-70 family)